MTQKTIPNSEIDSDQVHAQVQADMANIPFRQPIVDDYDPTKNTRQPGEDFQGMQDRARDKEDAIRARDAKIDHQWLAITEVARRAIITSPNARAKAASFAAEPLNELLPHKALHELVESDPRTARMLKLAGKKLGSVLELDPVPDALLEPDIQHAPALRRKELEAEMLENWRSNLPEYYDESLEAVRHRVEQAPGISTAERQLVARRYRYARDVKLLGLMAELQDQPLTAADGEHGVIRKKLKSGTKLQLTEEAYTASPNLLDPSKWEKRRQLKDRVHIVTVDGKNYIMKERKTPRHTDTKEGGHVYGLTSEQEFVAAKEFAELGVLRRGDVELHWENPLGYVEFPDGYQFCLFEAEPGLKSSSIMHQLANEIMDSAEEYEQEFDRSRQRAKQIYADRKDLLRGYDRRDVVAKPKRIPITRAARRYKKNYDKIPDPLELTFEEFARLKAYYLIDEARNFLKETILDKDYVNNDMDGYAFRLHGGKRQKVEIIGFDFEYYLKDPVEAGRVKENIKRSRESGDSAKFRAFTFADTRAIALAASYGMLEEMGYTLPPVANNK